MNIPTAESELVQQAFQFWYQDHAHLRSPFPERMREVHRARSLARFEKWIQQLDANAEKTLDSEAMVAKLEEILFEAALPLATSEEERISILFPFLPRQGDPVFAQGLNEKQGVVADRAICFDGDQPYLQLTLQDETGKPIGTQRMDLPG